MANNYKSYLIPPAQFLSTCLRHTQKSVASRCVLEHTLLFNYYYFPRTTTYIFVRFHGDCCVSATHCQWEVITTLNWVHTIVTSRGIVSRLQTWSTKRRSSVTIACETQRKKTVSKEKHFQLHYEIIMRYSLPLKSVSQTFLCKVASVCFVFNSSICNADFHGSLVNSQNIGP